MPQPQQPQQPPPTVQPPTSNSVVIEDSKFTTHLPIQTPMPPVVTVVSHPTQQQQQQQIPSHLNQLVPHIQQHPQLQEQMRNMMPAFLQQLQNPAVQGLMTNPEALAVSVLYCKEFRIINS